jgi:hypothetical protein
MRRFLRGFLPIVDAASVGDNLKISRPGAHLSGQPEIATDEEARF